MSAGDVPEREPTPFGLEARSSCGRMWAQLTPRFHLISRDGVHWWLETEDRGAATEAEMLELARRLNELTRKPTIPEVMPLVRELYATPQGTCGCCLHIVLDDGNIEDDHVRFCVDWAVKHDHPKCAELARVLLRMSKTQRKKLYRTHGNETHGG